MEEPDLIELFVRPLHDSGAHYLVAGSLGSMLSIRPELERRGLLSTYQRLLAVE